MQFHSPITQEDFMPPTPGLSFTGLDEFVDKPIVENKKSDEEVSKVVRKSNDSPIIEDWVSYSEEENVSQTKIEKKTGNPQMDLHDQGVIDSGCSRHMIGNMSYLTDYEKIDGGYVAFGGNPKGGKIIGKCTIKTAKGKNRALIKAARIMLANYKLPTTFWAEAVNTACDVQNRVLVTKPHNKTHYELFLGRKPALSFMRPFGCLVTILNTIDYLGKFDGKANEGFFVGSGPNWLFDIDALTKSMNYEPVVARNQSNGNAGTKACHDSSPDAGFKPSRDDEKRYLKGQLKLGLWYPKDSPFDLVAYTDSDYAGASLDRKSTTRGTSSGTGPRCQETMGDTITQTRSKNVSTPPNDPLLARGNTLRSGEGTMQLNELIELCTNLQQRVLALEKTKTTQAIEIGRIVDIDANKERFTLYNVHTNEDMFGVNDLDGDEVIVDNVDVVRTIEETRSVVEEVIVDTKETINVATTTTTTVIIDDEITFAKALAELKSAKPPTLTTTIAATTITTDSTRYKVKGIVIHEEEQATTPTVSLQQPSHVKPQSYKLKKKEKDRPTRFARKEQEESVVMAEKDPLFSKKAKAEIAQENSSKRAGEELEQESSKKQKVEEDKESEELRQCLEIVPDDRDDVTIDATPLSIKSPTIVDYKIYKEGKKSYFQIIRTDGKTQMYLTFGKMLKNFDKEDLEVL
ncbi:retrovirus-related pol polyprotein from transposon TNT 1-94 [Tanacetum coccineum]